MGEEKKIYERCEHIWKIVKRYQEFVGRSSHAIFGGGNDYFKIVVIQECKKCGKINKV